MIAPLRMKIGLLAVGLTASLAAAQPQTYNLRVVPRFQVGDQVTYTITGRADIKIAGGDQKVVKADTQTRKDEILQEVLESDLAGKVTALRVTVVSATHGYASNIPKESAYDKKVTLQQVSAVARREGNRFVTDTRTITSAEMKELTASQVAMVKELLSDNLDFQAFHEATWMLLPAQPVAVGQSWEPSRQALDEWLKSNVNLRRMGAEIVSAKFTLDSAQGAIVHIRGQIQARAKLGNVPSSPLVEIAGHIHTGTGRWLTDSTYLAMAQKVEGMEVTMDGRQNGAIAFKAGEGRASAPPATAYRLGWPAPQEDKNRFRDVQAGVSLDVGEPFAPQKPDPPAPNILAQFASKDGGLITVTLDDLGRPVDMPEILADVLGSMRANIKDFRLLQTQSLTLSDNVPAVLIAAQGLEGKTTFLTVVAVDGKRLASVSAAAPTDQARLLAEVKRIATSLRVFEPDLAKAK